MLDIAIHDFADYSSWLPTIANWFFNELQDDWCELYGRLTQADLERRMAGWLERDRIPTALVAVAGEQVIGIVALNEKERQFGMAPWLAGLYVLPGYRHCGIGSQLLRAAECKARSIGLSKLYLYTPKSEAFYGTYGWSRQQEISFPTIKVTVMEKMLTPQNLFQRPPPAWRG